MKNIFLSIIVYLHVTTAHANQEIISIVEIALKNNPKINSFSSKKTAHIIALDYSLDGMIGIRHPLGMHSKNILVQNLYVNIDSEHYEKIVKVVTDSGLKCNFITCNLLIKN